MVYIYHACTQSGLTQVKSTLAVCILITVKPLIVDPPRQGHCIINLSTAGNSWDLKVLIQFEPPRRGQPLYKGQNMCIYIYIIVPNVWRFHCV